ncbi:unnamed protein product [Prorocentrum cordatum]|uniref:RWD domain-containing protein n=1 Tax=Prorocentrum cordatum TaxID=2364126 RepID=A0ABN9SF74_9DINO|nr:unnamed protein product [Polarella glacialis]
MSDGQARRRDEADALLAIFGEDFLELSGNSEWRFQYRADSETAVATLICHLPDDYPSCSPPVLVLDGPRRPTEDSEACGQFLTSFVPGQEFGLRLGEFFFFLNSAVTTTMLEIRPMCKFEVLLVQRASRHHTSLRHRLRPLLIPVSLPRQWSTLDQIVAW